MILRFSASSFRLACLLQESHPFSNTNTFHQL
jgi:hypothetical protein